MINNMDKQGMIEPILVMHGYMECDILPRQIHTIHFTDNGQNT